MANEDVSLITLHNAIVRRNGKDILSIDDFGLKQGESIALIGPNGAGKSTFINLITREVFPLYRDHPPVLFKGKSLVTLQEIKQCLGVVSATMQNQITVHLPVFEVVYGGLLGSLGVPRQYSMNEEGKAKVAKTLEFLGITHLADRDVMTLSSGQARRVLIARALVHDPEVLVLDEPTTGLDPEGMYYVRKTMRDLTAAGKAIILVTHYPEDIIPEIKRVVMIKDGKLFADKPKEEALTTECVSELFEVPLRILSQDGYYSLVTEYQFGVYCHLARANSTANQLERCPSLAEGARLEIVCAPKAYLGFESPSLRHVFSSSKEELFLIGNYLESMLWGFEPERGKQSCGLFAAEDVSLRSTKLYFVKFWISPSLRHVSSSSKEELFCFT